MQRLTCNPQRRRHHCDTLATAHQPNRLDLEFQRVPRPLGLRHSRSPCLSLIAQQGIRFPGASSQFTVEVIGSAFISAPFGFSIRKPTQHESGPIFLYFLFFTIGGMIGWMSAYFVPFRLLPYAWLRITNVAVAPIVGGFTARAI